MAEVRLKNIIKQFGDVQIIKNLSLDINDGEFLVLVGGSGCGKSTTLRLVAGLEKANSGDVFIGSNRVNDTPPKDRNIAMVFQNYALYPHMTVYDNIAFGLKLRKVDKAVIDQKVKEAAKILDLEPYLDRKPKQLSGGQRQRVALGRAIVRDAQVFLMDEPLSNLDAKLRAQTRTQIKKLHQKLKTTTVYVTHDQVEAMTMGDRIAVMKDGIIQQLETPKTTYDFPENLFVAGFIGSPSMNFLDVEINNISSNKVKLKLGAMEFEIPYNEKITNISTYKDKSVILGIRPEYFFIKEIDNKDKGYQEIKTNIDVLEPSGSRTYLHVTNQDKPITAEVDTTKIGGLKENQELILEIDINRIHLFDKDTEKRILSTQKFIK